MQRLLLIVALVLLAACGGDPAPIPQWQSATAVPTAVPLDQVDLEPLLIQSGDLPAGLSGAQVKDEAPAMFAGVPHPTKAIDQRFQRAGDTAGGITVLLYQSDADRDVAYADVVKGLGKGAVAQNGVGERAMAVNNTDLLEFVDLTFVRCHAVVHIRFSGTSEPSDAAAYAKRLDKRLSSVVCS